MKKITAIIAVLTAITAISACSAKALDTAAETTAAKQTPAVTTEAETSAETPAVTALETTEDSRAAAPEEIVVNEDVEIYGSNGIMAVDIDNDGPVCFSCADEDTAEYRNSVFILSVDVDTPKETVYELFDKYDLDIVYDYENFNMYAVSVKEPLDAEQTAGFINTLEEYDFILMVEPDSVVYLDSSAEVQ